MDYAFAPQQAAFYDAVLSHKDPVPDHPPITKDLLYAPTQDGYSDRSQDPYGISAATDYAYSTGWGHHHDGAQHEYYQPEPPPPTDVLHTEEAPSPSSIPTDDDDGGSTSDE